MIRKLGFFFAIGLPIFAFALMPTAAKAQSFSGNWPLKVSKAKYSNGTYCMTLTDNGSLGFPHRGQASLTSPNFDGNTLDGSFQLINGLLTATFETQGDSGQNAGLVFILRAADGTMSNGVYDDVYDGEELDSGAAVAGAKGGCS